jgi:hypothetical protein
MPDLVIRFPKPGNDGSCALCGRPALHDSGPELFEVQEERPICSDCGRFHAPTLCALLDLARTAEQVGRISRHGPRVPLEKLLQLARAAEHYLTASPDRQSA